MRRKLIQLGKESVIYGVGGGIEKFIPFLLLPVFTRILSRGEYGS